jgi:hypothetical protein
MCRFTFTKLFPMEERLESRNMRVEARYKALAEKDRSFLTSIF